MDTEESNEPVKVEEQEQEQQQEEGNEDTKMEDAKTEAVEAIATDSTVEAAMEAAQIETDALTATAVSIAASASGLPVVDPSLPTQRDVKLGDENHPGTMLLFDLILLHKVLLLQPDSQVGAQASDPQVQELATRLTTLILQGKQFGLAGLKDVPRPFLVGKGRIFDKKDDEFVELTEEVARERLVETIVERFNQLDQLNNQNNDVDDENAIANKGIVDKEVLDAFEKQFRNKKATAPEGDEDKGEGESKDDNAAEDAKEDAAETSATCETTPPSPRAHDVLFLPTNLSSESIPYDHPSGNKHLLHIVSQNVVVDTKEAAMRVQIALKMLTCKIMTNTEGVNVSKQPRYLLLQAEDDNANSTWKEIDVVELAQFATIFVFEVYLEKQIHEPRASIATIPDTFKASTEPLEQHTVHDVLFGRGGMTNGHPGNRRFRDIIALHRPDYIRASKMDKPKVARRIVRAIRMGNPPGRFLKKGDDGKWYDVGDRCAAEKTSQGLRERSNTEKRQRSAMREALRIRQEDGDEDAAPSSKKAKTRDTSDIPVSLTLKEKKVKTAKKAAVEGDSSSTSDLPPNAVDKDGNILVTDHDILCGRGGLTNHHKGNKRFRDIVALHRPDYVRAPKIQKPSVARVIVRAIRNGDPPGRFLKRDKKTGLWVDIGDKRAAEKTSQALREKTREEQAKAPGLSPFADMETEAEGSSPSLPLPEGEKAEEVAVEESTTEERKEEPKTKDADAKSLEMVEI